MLGRAAIAWLCLFAACQAQLAVITKSEVLITEQPAIVSAPEGAAIYLWQVPSGVTVVEENGNVLSFRAANGRHTVRCKTIVIDWDNRVVTPQDHLGVFVVGDVPQPDPDPDPDPDPEPDDVPFKVPGLTVMIIKDQGQVLPNSQQAIFTDSDIRKWLREKCHKQDGTTLCRFQWAPGYTDSHLSDVPEALRLAYRFAEQDMIMAPWLVINDGKKWTSQGLPNSVDEMMALLRTYE